ncbi:MAG: hypothetical protein FKY71_19500 [Spiribacter salinus]|uniref:Uncharacterized protein n=1 Tax=Spiribacter salinus TaxID=1335746 RepID=A0A540V7H2_9GAMM|nr:MAG: hypothetical protein FKY71_19500 [Spiribacter salinus]
MRDEARQWRETGEFEVQHNPRQEGDRELVHFFIASQLESKADRIEQEVSCCSAKADEREANTVVYPYYEAKEEL